MSNLPYSMFTFKCENNLQNTPYFNRKMCQYIHVVLSILSISGFDFVEIVNYFLLPFRNQ